MQKAVTLLELLIVCAIIGITAAVAAPTLSNYVPGIKLSGSARVLSGQLRQAQEKAITEQKPYGIRFNSTDYQLFTCPTIDCDPETETVQDTTSLASGLTLTPVNTATPPQPITRIMFSSDGAPTPSANIILTVNGTDKIINVSPAGFIKVQ